jgi:hypothetical protein
MGGTSQINCPSSNVLNTNKIDETGPGDFFFISTIQFILRYIRLRNIRYICSIEDQ